MPGVKGINGTLPADKDIILFLIIAVAFEVLSADAASQGRVGLVENADLLGGVVNDFARGNMRSNLAAQGSVLPDGLQAQQLQHGGL